MSWLVLLVILASVSCNAFAQIALRGAMLRAAPEVSQGFIASAQVVVSSPLLWLGLSLFGGSVLLWLYVLARVPVSIAYPMSALGYVVATVVAVGILGEAMDLRKLVGLSLIVAGVICLSTSQVSLPRG
jgi:multidrug transporter EmrE-like cation transporter